VTAQTQAGELFRKLHSERTLFIMPNASDPGTARLIEQAGFQALATSSAGLAFTLGLPDGHVRRETSMRHLGEIVATTRLPVSADLGNGYGDLPETVAETIRLAALAGAVGASIEDATGDPAAPQFELSLAKERIAAAAEAVRSLPFPFILTARAENFLVGRPCLDDTLKRLEAFSDAGADVLYAPALPDERALSAILAVAGGKPINMLATASGIGSDLEQLSSLGVRRVSLGSALTRLAFTAIRSAIAEVREGSLGFLPGAIPLEKTNELFS
jgi:2-methylisocitrate lyase-like PEP mutase family enzyme